MPHTIKEFEIGDVVSVVQTTMVQFLFFHVNMDKNSVGTVLEVSENPNYVRVDFSHHIVCMWPEDLEIVKKKKIPDFVAVMSGL